MENCCEGGDKQTMSFNITNSGDEAKTFRLFGGGTGLDSIDDNTDTDSDEIVLSSIEGCIAEDINPGAIDPITNRIYFRADSDLQVNNGETGALVDSIAMGGVPETPAYDSFNGRMYVPTDNDEVKVVNVLLSVIATVSVGVGPQTPIFDSVNNRMYVPNRADDTVSVISTASNTVIATITVGDRPVAGVFDLENNRVYIVNVTGQTVSVISTATNTVIATISLLAAPVELSRIYLNGSSIYVAVTNAVKVISTDTNTVTDTVTTSISSGQLVFTSISNTLYISDTTDSRVGYMNCDDNTFTGYIAVGSSPRGGVIDTTNELLMVSCSTKVSFIDVNLHTVVKELTVATVNSNDSRYPVYVADYNYIYFHSSEADCGVSTGFSVADTGDYLFTPVTISVNGGSSTMQEINNDTLTNPICICDLNIVGSDKGVFNSPLRKNFTNATGTIDNTMISLLAKFTAMQKDGVNVVNLSSDDFKTCVLDGNNYLQWVVPAGENISIDVKYCQDDILGKLMLEPLKQVVKIKKYIHGRFKFLIN